MNKKKLVVLGNSFILFLIRNYFFPGLGSFAVVYSVDIFFPFACHWSGYCVDYEYDFSALSFLAIFTDIV